MYIRQKQYHLLQYKEIYRSTVFFEKWLEELIDLESDSKILDLACGGGANTNYLAEKHKKVKFTGIDLNEELIRTADEIAKEAGIENIKFYRGDWYDLDRSLKNQFDGVISLQTLSWLSDYKEPLEKICELNPKWMAMSSLFYEGKINYFIKVEDYERTPAELMNYNIYSIELVREFLFEKGYKNFKYVPFEIDIDIERPIHRDIGTYTVKTSDNKRIQISAGLMMPWYFIFASK